MAQHSGRSRARVQSSGSQARALPNSPRHLPGWGLEALQAESSAQQGWGSPLVLQSWRLYDPAPSPGTPTLVLCPPRAFLSAHIPHTHAARLCLLCAFGLQLSSLLSPADEILFHPTSFQLRCHQLWDISQPPNRFHTLSSLCSLSHPHRLLRVSPRWTASSRWAGRDLVYSL